MLLTPTVTLFKNAAFLILDEIEMHLPPGQALPTVRSKALRGLTDCSFSFFKDEIMRTRMNAGGGSISDVRRTLNEAQDLYLNLMQHGNYTPGQQPVHDDARSRLHAMQAQMKALTDKVGSLSRDPNATSTQGNGGGTRRSRQRKDSDKNSPPDPTPLKDRDPTAMHKNGLTNAENVIANDLIKEKLKTMPDLPTIPEDADYSIIHEGKTICQRKEQAHHF